MNEQETQKLENKVLKILNKHIFSNDTIIAGISGGSDSIFLLHFLKKLPCKIIAAHINHKLRKDADKDEKFVKEFSQNTKNEQKKSKPPDNASIIFHLRTANIKFISQKSKQGLEETGRKIRYEFFKKLAEQYKTKFIITAHHADDNLETIIFNFARGAALQGLSGMQEIEFFTEKIQLFRPLLAFSKKQITEYLKFKKIKYREDKSNFDKKYSRNFIRHEIIPKLKKLNPNITETIAKNCSNIRETNIFMQETAKTWIKKFSTYKKNKSIKFAAKSFKNNPEAIKKIILLEAYKMLIGNTQNIETIHLEEVIKIIDNNIGKKEKKLGQTKVTIKKNTIYILKT